MGLDLSQETLESICAILGDTHDGFTKSQLKKKLTACGIPCLDDGSSSSKMFYTIGLNKKDWLLKCLATELNKTKKTDKLIKLLESIFSPVSFVSDQRLPNMLKNINAILDFAGAQINSKGQVVFTSKKDMIDGMEEKKKEPLKKETKPEKKIDYEKLKNQLISVSMQKNPQTRGYDFEKFLTALFGEFELKPREPFRIVGEQIDGSFDYGGDFYLLEAKWQQDVISIDEIRIFHAKIKDKSSFTRGAFFSYTKFDDYIFQQYNNKGSNFILITVNELYSMLDAKMTLQDFIYRKVRALAEEGITNKNVINP